MNPARREARRAVRRQRIVDAAMGIVARGGVDALTMPGLAEELGVSVGGLYRYFDSKGRLVLAMELAAVDVYDGFAEEALARVQDAGPMVRVRAVLDTWQQFAEQEPVTYRLLEALSADPRNVLDDTTMAELQAHIDPMLGRVVGLLDVAVAAGALTPGDNLKRVHVLWGTLQGLVMFRKQDRRRPDDLKSAALVAEALDALLIGWGSAPP